MLPPIVSTICHNGEQEDCIICWVTEGFIWDTLGCTSILVEIDLRKLIEWGFVINPYDWCVGNKSIQGSQCTVIWHVDNLKISSVNSDVMA